MLTESSSKLHQLHRYPKLHKILHKEENIFYGLLATLLTFINRILIFIYTAMLTNLLGMKNYSTYAMMFSCLFIVYYLSMFGVDQGISAFIPEMAEKKDTKSIGAYSSFIIRATVIQFSLFLIIGIMVSLLVFVFNVLPENSITYVLSFLWYCTIGALLWITSSYMEARNYPNTSLLIVQLIPSIILLIIFSIYSWFDLQLTLFKAANFTYFSYFLALMLAFIFIKKIKIAPPKLEATKNEEIRFWHKRNLELYFISITEYLAVSFTIILLHFFAPTLEAAGSFSVIVKICIFVYIIYSGISVVYTPKFSKAVEEKNISEVKSLLFQSISFNIITGLIPTIIIIYFGNYWLMQFGIGYLTLYYPLLAMTLINYVSIILMPLQLVAEYSPKVDQITVVGIIFFTLFILLTIICGRFFDIWGAVFAYGFFKMGYLLYQTIIVAWDWNELFIK